MALSLPAVLALSLLLVLGLSSGPPDILSWADDSVLYEQSWSSDLPDFLETGQLHVRGFGVLAVNATREPPAMSASYEVVDGQWVDVGPPERYSLRFPEVPGLAGEYHVQESEPSATLRIYWTSQAS